MCPEVANEAYPGKEAQIGLCIYLSVCHIKLATCYIFPVLFVGLVRS